MLPSYLNEESKEWVLEAADLDKSLQIKRREHGDLKQSMKSGIVSTFELSGNTTERSNVSKQGFVPISSSPLFQSLVEAKNETLISFSRARKQRGD